MIKKNKVNLIMSSAVILLPTVLGMIFWDKLPDVFATHINLSGETDNVAGKGMAVFGLPVLMLLFQWLGVFVTAKDRGNIKQSEKIIALVLWIIPLMEYAVMLIMYFATGSGKVNISAFMMILLGVLFVLLGNYLPKCKQNSTVGIKLPWTLSNEENWNRTHRLGGKVWFLCGFFMLTGVFLPEKAIPILLTVIIAVAVGIPTVYSYTLAKKQKEKGEYVPLKMTKSMKITAVICALILVCAFAFMFTGKIEIDFGADKFTVIADYYGDFELEYNRIDTVELKENFDIGVRRNGFGGPKLSMGTYLNDEFGDYSLYGYTQTKSAVIIKVGDEILVLSGKSDSETKLIYDELSARTDKN